MYKRGLKLVETEISVARCGLIWSKVLATSKRLLMSMTTFKHQVSSDALDRFTNSLYLFSLQNSRSKLIWKIATMIVHYSALKNASCSAVCLFRLL